VVHRNEICKQVQVQTEISTNLTAAKERRGDLSVDSMIVSSHLAQMRMFMLRRGIEFFAEQDSYGKRREFIKQVCEHNMLDMKLDSIVDYFLCDGQGLFYFRPTGDDYQLLYFPKDSYRAYRDQNNELESIVLVYSFAVKQSNAWCICDNATSRGGKKKYIRLKVYKTGSNKQSLMRRLSLIMRTVTAYEYARVYRDSDKLTWIHSSS